MSERTAGALRGTRRQRLATATPTGGRPRSPDADRAIMDATARVLKEEGYAGMSIERIAAEAGVGKATIYRRYRNRQELAAAAAVHLASHKPFSAPGDMDARTALQHALEHISRAAGSVEVLSMLGMLLAERPQAPAHLRLFCQHVFSPHKAAVVSILNRGVIEGTVREDAGVEVVAEALIGAFLAREISGLPPTPEWAESVVEMFWRGLATGETGGGRSSGYA